MFCAQCGANNADTAVGLHAVRPESAGSASGRSIASHRSSDAAGPAVPVQNYLVFAILATVSAAFRRGFRPSFMPHK